MHGNHGIRRSILRTLQKPCINPRRSWAEEKRARLTRSLKIIASPIKSEIFESTQSMHRRRNESNFPRNPEIRGSFAAAGDDSSTSYLYIYHASRTAAASYTLNSVRMSPNGGIVINLSLEIQTRPGFPNNLLRAREATRCHLPI